jgi:hypothetical protein
MDQPAKVDDRRKQVVVSKIMKDFAGEQDALNQFFWSTELCYGIALDSDILANNGDNDVHDVLSWVPSSVWYPNNQGRRKYNRNCNQFLQDVTVNITYTARAAIIYMFSIFENYLDHRLCDGQQKKWRPYAQKLACDRLTKPDYPGVAVQLQTVCRADLCGYIRNRIVHPPFLNLSSVSHPAVSNWRSNFPQSCMSSDWNEFADKERIIGETINYVVGKAAMNVEWTKRELRKDIPIEFFYAIYTMSNLNALAFQIEEALLMPGDHVPRRKICRQASSVRRKDLYANQPRNSYTLISRH